MVSAIRIDIRAGHVVRKLRQKEHHDIGDILRLAESTLRDKGFGLLSDLYIASITDKVTQMK